VRGLFFLHEKGTIAAEVEVRINRTNSRGGNKMTQGMKLFLLFVGLSIIGVAALNYHGMVNAKHVYQTHKVAS
jgi:hypothetical protein